MQELLVRANHYREERNGQAFAQTKYRSLWDWIEESPIDHGNK